MSRRLSMIRKGTKVSWKWSGGKAYGRVKEVVKHDLKKNIKGTLVTRNVYEGEPIYIIEQNDGDEVLKSKSEIKRAG
jgi:hypothetical protein